MSKLLSQEEINALLKVRSQFTEPEAINMDVLDSLTEQRDRVSVYNFKRPKLFAQDHMRVLSHIHEAFARGLSVYLSAQLRTMVDIRLLTIDQVLYSEYVLSSAPPTALYVMNVKDLQHAAILEMDPSLVVFIVEKLFGGQGVFLKKAREVSQIERRIMDKVMARTFRELERSWQQVYPMTLELNAFESNAEFVQIMPGVEPALVATFQVVIYEQRTLLNICYPYLLLERMLGRAGMKRWMSGVAGEASPELRERFEGAIRTVEVELRAELGRAVLPLQELMSLQEGDVIPLLRRTQDTLDVYLGDELRFRASPGKSGRHQALRIQDVLEVESLKDLQDEY